MRYCGKIVVMMHQVVLVNHSIKVSFFIHNHHIMKIMAQPVALHD